LLAFDPLPKPVLLHYSAGIDRSSPVAAHIHSRRGRGDALRRPVTWKVGGTRTPVAAHVTGVGARLVASYRGSRIFGATYAHRA
jgi:hypothetical protein